MAQEERNKPRMSRVKGKGFRNNRPNHSSGIFLFYHQQINEYVAV